MGIRHQVQGWVLRPVVAVVRWLARRRDRLPGPVLDTLERIRGLMPDRLVTLVTGRGRGRLGPGRTPAAPKHPTVPEEAPVRLIVGPANFAGQGVRWARAVEKEIPGAYALAYAIEIPGGFDFPADYLIHPRTYRRMTGWQARHFRFVTENFTHVLLEASRSLFADLYGLDPFREIVELRERGLAVATIAHGSDIRLPRRHAQENPWSPFADETWETGQKLQVIAEKNVAALQALGGPHYVSTPDLLDDLPEARWCPVVVDLDVWATGSTVEPRETPVVVHAPSNTRIKGSEFVDEAMGVLTGRGLVEYRRLEKVSSAEMPGVYRAADIVMEQFRLGSYGVAACEAMAAGKVVVGNVTDRVRARVRDETGLELPVVQAEPDRIVDVVMELVADRERMVELGRAGREFVRAVHDGRFSAERLSEFLLPAARERAIEGAV